MINNPNLIKIKKFLKTFLFVFLFTFIVFNKEGKTEEKYCHFYYNTFKGIKDDSGGNKVFEFFAALPILGIGEMVEQVLFFIVVLGETFGNGKPEELLNILLSLIGVVNFTESLPYQFAYDSNQYCG